jgi:adenylate cyclase
MELLRQLVDEGVTLDQLKEAVAANRLVLLPVDLLFAADCEYTLREAIELTGLDGDFLRRNYAALGLPLPDLDERCITEADLEHLRMLKQLLDVGLPEERLQQLARVFGRGAAQGAQAIVDEFLAAFLHSGDTERDLALRLGDLSRDLLPTLVPLGARPLLLHLRDLVRREAIGEAERRAGRLPGAREVAVCFADLTHFAELTSRLSTDDLGDLVERLSVLAAQAARPPVQLIKLIGDAAMLVGPDARRVLAAAIEFIHTVADDPDLPELRAGLAAGPALNRAGDWYGNTVNLASRLTDVARPGTLVASESVVAETGEQHEWVALGRRRLKGIDGDVLVFELRAALRPVYGATK